jgi:multiple sugar transport system permease protein
MPGLLFILPAAVVILLVMVYPLLDSISVSFTDRLFTYNKFSFTGADNYLRIFRDQYFWLALFNSLKFTLAAAAGSLVLGFLLALLLNDKFRFRELFRGMLFLPWVMPSMVVVLVFRWFYNDFYGYANYILVKFHLLSQPVNILASPDLAWLGVTIPIIWVNFPFVMLVILAALQSIDKKLYEAAQIDGANRWQSFWAVTFPALKPTLVIVIILEIIWIFSSFDLVYLLTKGGPGDATLTLSLYIYEQGFEAKNLGYASSLGTVMFLLLFVFTIVYFSLSTGKKADEI